ncbi:MAG: cell wall hydrolase, partial [Muribaculaceae bacterium]|nr:cell wall hydrolase [Muribaculaceae bacterium]
WRQCLTLAMIAGVVLSMSSGSSAYAAAYRSAEKCNSIRWYEPTKLRGFLNARIPVLVTYDTFGPAWMNVTPLSAYMDGEPQLPKEYPGYSFTTTRLGGVEVHDYDPDADYSSLMSAALDEALTSDNPEYALAMGEIYECQRNIKILDMELDIETTFYFAAPNTVEEIEALLRPHVPYYNYTQEELIALVKLVDGEAGWSFNTDEHQRAVASVVLNRTTSPDWREITSSRLSTKGASTGPRITRHIRKDRMRMHCMCWRTVQSQMGYIKLDTNRAPRP